MSVNLCTSFYLGTNITIKSDKSKYNIFFFAYANKIVLFSTMLSGMYCFHPTKQLFLSMHRKATRIHGVAFKVNFWGNFCCL